MELICKNCESTDVIKTEDGKIFCFTCMNLNSTDDINEIKAKEAEADSQYSEMNTRRPAVRNEHAKSTPNFIRKII
jgi:hypothetical protein